MIKIRQIRRPGRPCSASALLEISAYSCVGTSLIGNAPPAIFVCFLLGISTTYLTKKIVSYVLRNLEFILNKCFHISSTVPNTLLSVLSRNRRSFYRHTRIFLSNRAEHCSCDSKTEFVWYLLFSKHYRYNIHILPLRNQKQLSFLFRSPQIFIIVKNRAKVNTRILCITVAL